CRRPRRLCPRKNRLQQLGRHGRINLWSNNFGLLRSSRSGSALARTTQVRAARDGRWLLWRSFHRSGLAGPIAATRLAPLPADWRALESDPQGTPAPQTSRPDCGVFTICWIFSSAMWFLIPSRHELFEAILNVLTAFYIPLISCLAGCISL